MAFDITPEQLVENFRGGDQRAIEELLERFAPLVWKIVNRAARNLRIDRDQADDLFQYGQICVWRAAKKGYDPDRGCKFMTFMFNDLKRRIWTKALRTGGVVYANQVRCQTQSKDVTQSKRRALCVISIDEPLRINGQESKGSLAGSLTCRESLKNDDRYEDNREKLSRMLDLLSYRQRVIIKARMNGTGLASIGDFFGISRERVRQIETIALTKLHQYARE